MNYKSIFNVVSTNNFFKGGVVNRNTFFKNAAMLCVLVLVSIGCGDSSAQSTNQDGSRLVGTWVQVGYAEDGRTWVFNSDGTGSYGGEVFKYGAVAGRLVLVKEYHTSVDDKSGYDFVVSNDGKTLLIVGGAVPGRDFVLKKSTGK